MNALTKAGIGLICSLVLGVSASASATFYNPIDYAIDSIDLSIHESGSGLEMYATTFDVDPFTIDHDFGWHSFDAFEIGTLEDSVNWFEDDIPKAIQATFHFSKPGTTSGTVSGTTFGHWTMIGPDKAKVLWLDPILLYSNGTKFSLGLTDTYFDMPGSTVIRGTVTQIFGGHGNHGSGQNPVPEPGSGLLFAIGSIAVARSLRTQV